MSGDIPCPVLNGHGTCSGHCWGWDPPGTPVRTAGAPRGGTPGTSPTSRLPLGVRLPDALLASVAPDPDAFHRTPR